MFSTISTINEWISSCQQVLGESAGGYTHGEMPNEKRLVYNSDYRTDPQPPTEQQKQQLHVQKERLIKEHVEKHGWVELKHYYYNVSSYYYDKKSNLIYEIEHGIGWNNNPIPAFKVVNDDSVRSQIREWNNLEPWVDIAPAAFDPFA